MTWHERMRDAANAAGIPSSWRGAVAGYVRGGDPAKIWTRADWQRFDGQRKLPIFVRSDPGGAAQAENDAFQALRDLWDLGVPAGVFVALDLETAVDRPYVHTFSAILARDGSYKLLVYGSRSTVTGNPPAAGYWIADYAGVGPFMVNGARATQYANGKLLAYDSSTVRWWTYWLGRWWK